MARPRTATAKNRISRTTYDILGRVTVERDNAGRETDYSYDSAGRLDFVTDAEGRKTTYGYDALSRRITTRLHDNATTTVGYDAAGRMKSREVPSGRKQLITYLFSGQVDKRDYLDGSGAAAGSDTFSYDAFMRPTGSTSRDGVVMSNTWNDRGLMATETTQGLNLAYTVTYDYNSRGELIDTQYPSGRHSALDYNARRQLRTIHWNNQLLETRTYDPNRSKGSGVFADQRGQASLIRRGCPPPSMAHPRTATTKK